MSTPVTLNGILYNIPNTGEVGYGTSLTNFLVAVGSGAVLPLSGGAFTLTDDLNFGSNFGLHSKYYKGLGTTEAASGVVRLSNTETVAWRNAANTADLALSIVGDTLYFNGAPIGGGGGSSPLTTKGDLYTYSTFSTRLPVGVNGQVLMVDSSAATGLAWGSVGGSGSGTVTGVSVVTANGVSGSVANPTTTPAITLSLGDITPTSVAASGTITGSNLSGTNTGNQTITLTGDVTGSGTGTFAATLATVGIAKGGTGQTTANAALNALLPSQTSNSGKVLYTDGTNTSWQSVSGGSGVSSVSGINGVTVTSPTTTPVIGLGAITPTSVAASGTVTGSNISGTSSGTNTGDQAISLTNDVTGTWSAGTITSTLKTMVGLSAGTYSLATVTVDTKGRVTAIAAGSAGSGTVTSVGLTGSGDITVGGTSPITSSGTFSLSLANTTVTPGSYNNVTVDSKGRVTGGSNASYITGNQSITLSGDVTGSGTTGIVGTLASTGVVAGSYTLPTITIDAKGRITAAANGGTSVANLITNSSTTAVGINAAVGITTAAYNTAMGNNALRVTATGQYNTAIGDQSMRNNTGNSNTATGYLSLYTNTSGFSNAAFGREALYSTQTTGQNAALGSGAGYSITGSNNTAVGYNALWASTTGSNNTGLGYNAASSTTTVSNQITLGNSSITSLRCQVTSITALSDVRDKTDIVPLTHGLDFVKDLKPVAFTWNMRDGGKVGIKSSGFIAQDLLATEVAHNAKETLNLVMDDNPDKLEATYGHLIPVLVKAIQELKAELDALKLSINI